MTVIGVITVSCSRYAETEMAAATSTTADGTNAQFTSAPAGHTAQHAAQLIRTVQYRFETKDVAKTTEAITAAIAKYPAYISTSSLNQEHSLLENRISIRVQHDYFDALMSEIDQQATFVNSREVKTQDVSREFVDLESRLKTKRQVEERYIDILRNKAGTIDELLNAERQIGALQEEIEATISRINYLRDQIAYSTINLAYYQVVPHQQTAGDQALIGQRLREAVGAGWEGMMTLVVALTYLWPLLLSSLIVLVVLRLRNIRLRTVKP